MIRNFTIDILVGLFFANVELVGQGNCADVLIEAVTLRVAIVVCLVSADGERVPLGCEYAFTSDGFKPLPYSTDSCKQVDKSESGLFCRLGWKQGLQMHVLCVGKTRRCLAFNPTVYRLPAMQGAYLIKLCGKLPLVVDLE